jgi:hypothetical protein
VPGEQVTDTTDAAVCTAYHGADARDATYLMTYFPGPVTATIDTGWIAAPRQ